MGIQGLLPVLKSIITPVHVRTYAGKSAAIDTYSWLHKAAFSCSKELCEGRPTDKLIEYCMHRVNLLRYYGVQPVLVFDGGVLPMKADQELKRARSRKENLERARIHEREGNRAGAHECYQRAVDITPALAARLIKVLQQEGVQYVVAPYEADAQMAYLAFHGHVDVIITEDSDLIAYGCPRVFFKMDKSGQGEAFEYDDLVRNNGLSFKSFTKQMVLEMCVMTGCDYLPSLPGMGVKKAHGLIQRFRSYQKVIRHLRFSGTTISAQYEELFGRALLTFHHQRVYDPVSQQMVHLTDVPDDVTVDLEFVGPDLPQELVRAIAVGDVDPSTNLPFQEALTAVDPALPRFGAKFFPNRFVPRKPVELFPQKNVVTNYFLSESKVTQKEFKAPRKVLSTEKETENRPAKNTLCFDVPEAGDLASIAEATEASATPLSEVFGTPLPDDDEDSVSGSYEAHNNIPGWESQESLELRGKIRSRPGVLQGAEIDIFIDACEPVGLNGEDSLESSVFDRVSSESATTRVRFFGKDRKNSIVDAPPIKLSSYFSHSHAVRSESTKPHNADCPTSMIETDLKDADSWGRQVTKKSRIDIGRAFFENLEGGSGLEPPVPYDDLVSYATRRSGERSSSSFENRNQASPIILVPRGGGSSEVGKFATNVSHVDQYASVAQKSVEKFAQTLESFRWSSKGARASGLRKPMATISTNTSTRIATTGHPPLEAALDKFSYKPSCFKPPFRNPRSSRTTGAATTGAVRAQENECEPHRSCHEP